MPAILTQRACALLLACAGFPPLATALSFNWNGGDFVTGVTAPEPMPDTDTLFIGPGAVKRFVGANFTNLGTVRWQSDTLQGGNGTVVTNAGTWVSEADSNTLVWAFGGQATFINTGVFTKQVGTTTNVGSWLFRNDGGVIAAEVGTIVFNGASNVFNAGSTFTGAGQIEVSGGGTFNGAFFSDNLTLSGGTLQGNGATLAGGAGASAGLLGWSGGDVQGSWTIGAGTVLTGSGAASKRQVGSTITNDGTFLWTTTQQLQGGNGSSFLNNGLTEATASAAFNWNFGGQHQFTNAASGTVRASNGATLTIGEIALTSNGGRFEAEAGSAMAFTGASNRFNDGTRFVGDMRMTGTARFVGAIEANQLRFLAGTQIGGDGVTPGSHALLSGTVGFEGGDLQGAWTIGAGTTLTSSGAASKRQVGSSIINDGTFLWTTTQQLQGGNGSSFLNNGLTEATASAAFNWNFGGQHQFTNATSGTVRASNGATLTIGDIGMISNGGLFEAMAGSAMAFTGASNRFNDGTRFVGDMRMTGTARFVGAIEANQLRFLAGTQIGGDGVTPGSHALLSGTVGFEGGDLQGAWTIGAGTTLTSSGAASKRQVGSNIINDGTFLWTTTQQLQGGNGSSFLNNGLTEATASAAFNWNFGGQHQFTNAAGGTVRASNGASLTIGDIGMISNGGLFEAMAGSAIVFAGGSNRFNDGTRFSGLNRVTGSARYVGEIVSDGLRLVSGTQTGGDGSATSSGNFDGALAWEGGDLAGQFEIRSGSVLTASGAASKRLLGANLVNRGTMRWDAAAGLQGGNGSLLVNEGLFELTTDADLTWNFGGQARLHNHGLLRKSAGNGDSSLGGLALINDGVIAVDAGSISLPANFINTGTLRGTGAFNVGGTLRNDGHVGPGASPGTLTVNGNYAQSAVGTLDIELEDLLSHDRLNINGTASLAGVLAVSCFASCQFAVGDELVILDAVGVLSGSFGSLVLSGFGSGAFDVIYDLSGSRVLLRVTQAVTPAPVPLPAGLGLLLAGLFSIGATARRRR